MTDMRLQDFLFKEYFDITDKEFLVALEMVKTRFHGVAYLWAIMPTDIATSKRKLCYSNLLAWQLMQLYPDKVTASIDGVGSMPLDSKSIHDISLSYRNVLKQDGHGILDSLTTNYFGMQALLELQSAPESYMLQM